MKEDKDQAASNIILAEGKGKSWDGRVISTYEETGPCPSVDMPYEEVLRRKEEIQANINRWKAENPAPLIEFYITDLERACDVGPPPCSSPKVKKGELCKKDFGSIPSKQ